MTSKRWSKAPKLAKWAGEGEGQGRTYVDPTTGLEYPSVTTILKNTPKEDMMGWAALKVAETIIEEYDRIGGDPDEVMKWLPFAHNRYRDERAWVGSGVHATIQAEHEESWDFHELTEEQEKMLGQWERFKRVYKVTVLYSEVTVLGDGYMGTFDALIEYTDPFTGERRIALIDIKTSKSTWEEHHMQIAALSKATHIFVEVPEGTEGAALRKGRVKAENSWWIKEEMPTHDEAAIVHLRDDFWDYIPLDSELRYDEFMVYVQLKAIKQKIKEELA